MRAPHWTKRFLASTRGRIITLLRSSSRTVNELAEALDLTDNAVRAHLAALERDGLVQHRGTRRGLRKPHHIYVLTPEAEYLFPKAYGEVLDQLLDVLTDRLPPKSRESILREVGRRIAARLLSTELETPLDLEQRLEMVVEVFGELGGLAAVEKHNGHLFIRGDSCPLAAVSGNHPEVCRLAETLVVEIVRVPVQVRCNRDGTPQCCFEITP
jgi:predicted ArsR family transcriptional regulator